MHSSYFTVLTFKHVERQYFGSSTDSWLFLRNGCCIILLVRVHIRWFVYAQYTTKQTINDMRPNYYYHDFKTTQKYERVSLFLNIIKHVEVNDT